MKAPIATIFHTLWMGGNFFFFLISIFLRFLFCFNSVFLSTLKFDLVEYLCNIYATLLMSACLLMNENGGLIVERLLTFDGRCFFVAPLQQIFRWETEVLDACYSRFVSKFSIWFSLYILSLCYFFIWNVQDHIKSYCLITSIFVDNANVEE